jgi:hypothetical protein
MADANTSLNLDLRLLERLKGLELRSRFGVREQDVTLVQVPDESALTFPLVRRNVRC